MGAKADVVKSGESPRAQFCTLGYRPQDLGIVPGKEGPILLVLKGVSGNLRLLVNPELDQIVQARDLDFVESLLKDFSARAKNHPADLFKQLSSLNVGPVVTQEAGSNLSDSPDIQELCARFVQI